MPRIARIVMAGYPHHITQRGNNRQIIFIDNSDKQAYLSILEKYLNECSCCLHAYCLMPNHIHLLCVPETESQLAKMMQKVSLTYTQYVNKKYKRTGRLWECRYFSAIVSRERYLLAVSLYIDRNPVRAGIVGNAIDYPWSSAHANTTDTAKTFITPIFKTYTITKEEYRNMLQGGSNEEEIGMIRKATTNGMPLGSMSFIENLGKVAGKILDKRQRGRPRKIKS